MNNFQLNSNRMTAELLKANELHKVDPVFGQVSFDGHEQVVFCHDKDTGLKAIIGIHNTVLGPALGGTRMSFRGGYRVRRRW